MGRFLFGFILVIVAFFLVRSNPGVASVLIGLAAFILFFFRSREAIILYTIYFSFEDFILLHTPADWMILIQYMGDILILAVFVAVFAKLAMRRHNLEPLRENYLHIPLLLFLTGAVLSALINEVPLLISFISIRQLLRYVVLYYAILITAPSEWRQRDLRTLLKIMVALVLIQAGIGYIQVALGPSSPLIQSLFLSPPEEVTLAGISIGKGAISSLGGKALMGTLLVSNTFGLFLVFGLSLFLGMYTAVPEFSMRRKFLMFSAFLIIPLLLSYSRQSLYAGLFAALIIGWLQKNVRILMVGLIIIAALSVYLIQIKEFSLWGEQETLTIPQRAVSPFHAKYLERYQSADRLLVIREVIPSFFRSQHVYLGLGPGAFGSSFGMFQKYVEGYHKLGIFDPQKIFIVHIGAADVGFAAILGQFGIIGFTLFFSLFFFLFRVIKSGVLPQINDPLWRGAAIGFLGYTIALLVSNVGQANFALRQLSFYFWVLGGVVSALRWVAPEPLEEKKPAPLIRQPLLPRREV